MGFWAGLNFLLLGLVETTNSGTAENAWSLFWFSLDHSIASPCLPCISQGLCQFTVNCCFLWSEQLKTIKTLLILCPQLLNFEATISVLCCEGEIHSAPGPRLVTVSPRKHWILSLLGLAYSFTFLVNLQDLWSHKSLCCSAQPLGYNLAIGRILSSLRARLKTRLTLVEACDHHHTASCHASKTFTRLPQCRI